MKTQNTLIHAVTVYDAKESRKRHWNPHALPQYLERAEQVAADIERGADPRAAIVAGFSGRLCAAVLREFRLPKYTKEDAIGSGIYRPITPEE